jgi:hypothetical protein
MIELVREVLNFTGAVLTLGFRPNRSDHPIGKAADFMISDWRRPSGVNTGNRIVNLLDQRASDIGLKYWIWRGQIDKGSGSRPYTHPSGVRGNPTLDHYDHVHASVYDSGGFLPPGLSLVLNATGGPEPVLTQQDYEMLRRGAQSNGDTFVFQADPSTRRYVEQAMRTAARERDILRAREIGALL